jgi:hypothetical protein
MRRADLSLDEEIAEVERRLAHRRAQLHRMAAEARSRIGLRSATPVALLGALAAGFVVSRVLRRRPRAVRAAQARAAPRAAQIAGALASVLLPVLIRPLQSVVSQWLHERMRRPRSRPEDPPR